MNTARVETRLSGLKSEFEELKCSGQCSDQVVLLFQSLFALLETMLMIWMEKQTPKTPANSGLPSSTSTPDEGAQSKKRSKQQRREQSYYDCSNTRLEETSVISPVEHCQHCGHDLTRVTVQSQERRTLVDVVFVTQEHHVDAEIKRCPVCDRTSRGSFPDQLHGPLQYGAGVVAFVVNLLVSQMVSVRRTAQLVKSMTGRLISESTWIEWVMRVCQALEEWEQVAIEKLVQMPVMHVDETSIRINRKNHWIHTCTSGDLGLMLVHTKRGQEAMDDINIIPRYGGARSQEQEGDESPRPVLMHDRWASYFKYAQCDHALCGHHLQRDLQFILDAHQHRWARKMLKLLLQTHQEVAKTNIRALSETRYVAVRKQYRRILTQGARELPDLPARKGQRGKPPKTDAHNLHQAFQNFENEILRFARNPFCPYTSNSAERFHRMSKVKQEMSGTFRSFNMAQACCRVTSHLQTMNMLGYNPLTAIERVLKGEAVDILKKKL